LLINVPEGQPFETIDDLVAPHPTTLLGVTPKETSLLDISTLFEKYGRSYGMMHNDDWVAFMKESKSRFASYNAEKKSRKPSVVKERPSQLVRVVDLTDIVTAAADSSRLQKLADATVDTGPHVWTLSATPTMEEVQTAKEARDSYSKYRAKIDAEAALSKLESDEMNLKTLKLKRQSTPSTSLKITMIAEDVPLPDDEGLEDEVVSENIEGSSLEEKIGTVDDDAPVLGARKTIADIVSAIVNRLGFSINGDERDKVVDTLMIDLKAKTHEFDDKIDKLTEVYVAKGFNADTAKLLAVDEMTNRIISSDVSNLVLDSAFDCMILLIHKSAQMARPLVKRLSSKWAPKFTLNLIFSPTGEASLVEYVSRVLADMTNIQAQDSTLQLDLEYAMIVKHFQMSLNAAMIRDDVIRSIETLRNLVTDTVAPEWFNLKPDINDEKIKELVATRTSTIQQNTKKSSPLPISYDTEAIVDQAPAEDPDKTLALSKDITQIFKPTSDVDMNGVDKKVLADLKSKAAQNGVSAELIDMIDHSDEDTLFAIIDRYIPAFTSALMVTTLNKWQVSTYEKSGLVTAIVDARKKLDRAKLTDISIPQRMSKYRGMIIADARESSITDCYKFLISVHDVGGFELLKLFDTMVTVLNTRVSEEEEIKILQARREAVKMAKQTVRSNLPTELQWMYEDLKMQGVVDVARDAVLEPEAGEVAPEQEEEAQERLDGYDLDEHFSDAEDDN
jgi:hypothetical protein